MTSYSPFAELKTGANLTGSTGDSGRTYVLANDDAIFANMQVMVAGASLQPSTDFTLNTITNTVTFVNAVWDDQAISIDYWTETTAVTPTGDNYGTTLQAVRWSGIGVQVELESLGTGNGVLASYDTNDGFIIADSYTVEWGVVGSNSLTPLVEGGDYSLDKDSGSLTLTSAGITTVTSKAIYISYTHSPKVSDTVLATYLPAAAREVEKLTQNYWGTATSNTEYFDGYTSGYPQTDRPFGTTIEYIPEFELSRQGIQSITSVTFLDPTGAVTTTVDSDYVQFEEMGRVILANGQAVPNGKKNVKIIYSSGYTAIPSQVEELASLIAGFMALVNISGGSYDDLTSYQIGRVQLGVGEAYVNIREVLSQLQRRIDKITDNLGNNYGCA